MGTPCSKSSCVTTRYRRSAGRRARRACTSRRSNLEVTSELARNHQRHGCIDGCYRFDEPERARSFAVLALDFVKRMLEKRIEQIEALDTGAEFTAPEHAAAERQ